MGELPLKQKLIYATGNLGIALITGLHMLHLVYFFLPPKDAGLPYLIPQSSLFLGLTALGLVIATTRMLDAVLDPVVANYSDRLNHRLGRRIPLMRWAIIPFAVCHVLVFILPVNDDISMINIAWLLALLSASALFFTAYAIPFYSLMVDLAKSSDDKVDLGTISSAFWFVGFLSVHFAPWGWIILAEALSISTALSIQIIFAGIALLGTLCLALPAFLIREDQIESAATKSTKAPLIASLKHVLKNHNFRYYLGANTLYTIATSIYEAGLIYYITVLARQEAQVQGYLALVIGMLTLASYPLVNIAAKRQGKKRLLQISLFLFAGAFAVTSLFGIFEGSFLILVGILVIISPFAQASFGILPQVMTSDCAAYDTSKSDEDHAGMYMAANGFFAKVGRSIGAIFLTSFLLFGKDIGDDMGIRVAAAFGGVVSIIGAIILAKYDEREILTYMDTHSRQDAAQ
ncbi:MFS transporter [Parasphingorhabdus sp.]|uniref:MFS transporter n=1 Tax=Parasphingorhabdus sp. TaxID=2709688 RepID=UPI00326710FF